MPSPQTPPISNKPKPQTPDPQFFPQSKATRFLPEIYKAWAFETRRDFHGKKKIFRAVGVLNQHLNNLQELSTQGVGNDILQNIF